MFRLRFDILGFSNFLHLLQWKQYILFMFLINENVLMSFYHSFYFYLEKMILHTQKLQKYAHIIESYACTL